MMVILCNGVTLGMYDPYDDKCETERCKTLEVVETCIYSFFVFEMLVKMLAMGIRGKLGYFNVSWNRLDFFIVCARYASLHIPYSLNFDIFMHNFRNAINLMCTKNDSIEDTECFL